MSDKILYHIFEKYNTFFLVDSFNQFFWNIGTNMQILKKVEDLVKFGFFSDPVPSVQVVEDSRSFDINHLVLNPSTECNLDCWYCYSSKIRKLNMSELKLEDLTLILNIVLNYKTKIESKSDITVSLGYTQEVTQNFDLFLKIKRYLEQEEKKHDFQIFLFPPSTNLFKTNSSFVDFINEYGYLTVSINLENKIQKQKILENLKLFDLKVKKHLIIPIAAGSRNLFDVYNEFFQYFDFVSIRPVRVEADSVLHWNEDSLAELKDAITQLFQTLLNKKEEDLITFLTKIGPTDYLGRYLERVINRTKTLFRCQAGKNAYAVDPYLDVYPCSGMIGIQELKLGRFQLDTEELKFNGTKFELLAERDDCSRCCIQYYCGGPCIDWLYKQNGNLERFVNKYECGLNKHIFEEIVFFVYQLQNKRKNVFRKLLNARKLENNLTYALDFDKFHRFFTQ
ncbi:MAG: SPASM domain-containing protein [Candidatus Heimdallarchaeaceae archaeon]